MDHKLNHETVIAVAAVVASIKPFYLLLKSDTFKENASDLKHEFFVR